MANPQWLGQPGHFIGAAKCIFHLHTHVNGYCISTVGEYNPVPGEGLVTVRTGYLYETMVFKLGEDGEPENWSAPVEMVPYNTRDLANAGHMILVEKWSKQAASS